MREIKTDLCNKSIDVQNAIALAKTLCEQNSGDAVNATRKSSLQVVNQVYRS